MDRLNYYFRQKVTEAELDLGFTLSEDADQALMTDLNLVGIVNGLVATQRGAGANLSIDVSAGFAYDKNGQRIRTTAVQNVDVSVDESAVTTAVIGGANSKIISVFAKFKRVLTDPRTDGNSITVYFSEAESFEFVVRQSAEAPVPTPVALDPAYILVADIARAFGQTTIVNANIDTTATNRREEVFKITQSVGVGTRRIQRGRIGETFSDMLLWLNTEINDRKLDVDTEEARALAAESGLQGQITADVAALAAHIADAVDAHDASAISYTGSANWADGSSVTSTDVESALDEIVADLTAAGGAAKIGTSGNGAGYVFGTSGTTVQAQLDQISDYLDEGTLGKRVHTLTGNTTITTHRQILADTTGGAFNLTLPAPTHGREIIVKDPKGTWGTNNLTLVRAGGEKIENVAANRVLSGDFTCVRIFSDGTDWFLD